MAIEPRSLRAIRLARTRRKRSARAIAIVTVGVGTVTLTILLVWPGTRSCAPSPPGRSAAPSVPQPLPPPSVEAPVVRVHPGVVELEGAVVDRPTELQRVERLDGLFAGLKERRADWIEHDGATQTVVLYIDAQVEVVTVKSVMQTCAFAGFGDVRIVLVRDGGG